MSESRREDRPGDRTGGRERDAQPAVDAARTPVPDDATPGTAGPSGSAPPAAGPSGSASAAAAPAGEVPAAGADPDAPPAPAGPDAPPAPSAGDPAAASPVRVTAVAADGVGSGGIGSSGVGSAGGESDGGVGSAGGESDGGVGSAGVEAGGGAGSGGAGDPVAETAGTREAAVHPAAVHPGTPSPARRGPAARDPARAPRPAPRRPWARWTRRPRVTVAGGVIGVLLGLLGFALVVQLRSNATDPQLASARPEDLVRILSDLDARKDRLSQEINSLETTKQQLEAGSEGRSAALAEASKRAQELGILAGTLPAQGTGMTVRMVPGNQPLKAWIVLDTVEELRGAGAEAMEISGYSGGPVRIVASTYFVDHGSGLLVDGQALAAPYTITVIGDPQTMQPALNIAGGVTDTVHQANGTVIVEQGSVRVTATHTITTPRYAQPVS